MATKRHETVAMPGYLPEWIAAAREHGMSPAQAAWLEDLAFSPDRYGTYVPKRTLAPLVARGLVRTDNAGWAFITPNGVEESKRMRKAFSERLNASVQARVDAAKR
jgi:hypothetical protein